MKVCKFCEAENNDSATTCKSCGGNQFSYKCVNCGTLFDEGNFCPKCGVKAGTTSKICPICGKEYYSAACPDCGYTPNTSSTRNSAVYTNMQQSQPQKKSKTWLWILGWICIFPLPLTILMLRNQKLDKRVRIGIIVAAWIVYLIIGITGNSGKNFDTTTPNTTQTTQAETTEKTDKPNASDISKAGSSETTTNDEAKPIVEEKLYSEDDYVNQFITEYNAVYPDAPVSDISKGNIKQKCFVNAGGCYIELLDSYDATANDFNVTINGGNTQKATDSMFAEFPRILKILDPALTNNQINGTIDEWQTNNHMKENYTIGKNITCTFVPMVKLSYGISSSRIDIACSNYGK